MRTLIICLLLSLAVCQKSMAYPQDQLADCIKSAQNNPAVQDISTDAIEKYCDCALKLIVDESKDLKKSGFECAKKYFDN